MARAGVGMLKLRMNENTALGRRHLNPIFAEMTWVAPYYTFPPISWWMQAARYGSIMPDANEDFEKMSWRNRYRISGPNNPILLTVPILHGREQRGRMADIRIYNMEKWQVRHWRTLVSVYNRTPFFEYFAPALRPLFENEFEFLVDFNLASIKLVNGFLNPAIRIEEDITPERTALSLRGNLQEMQAIEIPSYYQVFEDRIGYQYDLSILDLLFSEGPASGAMLKL